jgi:hypothetical protein
MTSLDVSPRIPRLYRSFTICHRQQQVGREGSVKTLLSNVGERAVVTGLLSAYQLHWETRAELRGNRREKANHTGVIVTPSVHTDTRAMAKEPDHEDV